MRATAPGGAELDTLTIARPDDWHLHVRDGPGLQSVVPHTAAHYGRAVIMPNLVPPVTTTELVSARPRCAPTRWRCLGA
jgi:dihydroorotase